MRKGRTGNLDRREFLGLLALVGATTALSPGLVSCSSADYVDEANAIRALPFTKEPTMSAQSKQLIRYAVLAPSGHNTQPWKFSIKEDVIRIFPDYSRRLPAVDPDDRELFISLGCALENLVVSARYAGFDPEIDYFPTSDEESIVVRMKPSSVKPDETLFKAIPVRQCTRNEYNGQPLPSEDMKKIEGLQKEAGVGTMIFTDPKEIEKLIEIVKEGDNIQMNDKAFVKELKSWIRFSDREALKTRDGLSSRAGGNPIAPQWLGNILMDFFAGGKSQGDKDRKMAMSSSGMILFVSEKSDKRAWVAVGRTWERYALTSTALAVKSAFLNQPAEIGSLAGRLQGYLSLGSSRPQLLARFGYSDFMPYSLRRPVEAVLV